MPPMTDSSASWLCGGVGRESLAESLCALNYIAERSMARFGGE